MNSWGSQLSVWGLDSLLFFLMVLGLVGDFTFLGR